MSVGDRPFPQPCPTCGCCPTCGSRPNVYWPNWQPYWQPVVMWGEAAAAPNNMTYQMVNTAGAN